MDAPLSLLLFQAAAVAPVRAETLLVRPVAVPTHWYDVASGVLAIVAILLLLGLVVMLLGAVRAMKGTESSIGRKVDALGAELIPALRHLNEVAGDLQEITRSVKGELSRVSSTVGAVDSSVRSVLETTEARIARVAALVDEVTDEAEQNVADARAVLAGVRGGARGLVTRLTGGGRRSPSHAPDHDDEAPTAPRPGRADRGRDDQARADRPRAARGTPRGLVAVPPPRDVVDEEEEWHAPPLPRNLGARARRGPIAPAAAEALDPAWESEADALIAEAERALDRVLGAPSDAAPPPRPAPPVADPWRAGGPRRAPRPEA